MCRPDILIMLLPHIIFNLSHLSLD
uniref:Uncharacterized protein n=1 Tax=Bacillus pumilus TaxID=1408 RepID=A0A9Q9PC64_BACPU|nr:hypothetical protein SBRMV_021 [Bacillus pumilus]